MDIRSIVKYVSLLAIASVANDLPAAATLTLPELRGGDVLLCEPYPYRTVTNACRTVYQIARLGFTSVRSFQQAHDLKIDGIIGPQTQRRVEAEFGRRFRQEATSSHPTLSVFIQPVATTTGITATVTLRNVAAEPMRIIGSLTYDEAKGFRFADPTVSLRTKTCLRRGNMIACGGRSATVALTQQETVMGGSTNLPMLAAGESGKLYTSIAYLSADLTERFAEADELLPKESQK